MTRIPVEIKIPPCSNRSFTPNLSPRSSPPPPFHVSILLLPIPNLAAHATAPQTTPTPSHHANALLSAEHATALLTPLCRISPLTHSSTCVFFRSPSAHPLPTFYSPSAHPLPTPSTCIPNPDLISLPFSHQTPPTCIPDRTILPSPLPVTPTPDPDPDPDPDFALSHPSTHPTTPLPMSSRPTTSSHHANPPLRRPYQLPLLTRHCRTLAHSPDLVRCGGAAKSQMFSA